MEKPYKTNYKCECDKDGGGDNSCGIPISDQRYNELVAALRLHNDYRILAKDCPNLASIDTECVIIKVTADKLK